MAARWLLMLCLAGGVWGQSGQIKFVGAPAPAAGGGRAGHGHGVHGGIGFRRAPRIAGGWGWGGWGWWNPEPLRVVIQSEPQKEKEAPAYVTNSNYVPERPAPRLTEVAAAPALQVRADWNACAVTLKSGERFEGAQCAEVDDTVLVKSHSGRRYRFSRDLVDTLK